MLKVPEFRFTPTPYHQAKALDKLSAMGTVVVEPPHRQMMTDAQLEVFYLPAGSVTAGAFVPNIVAMQRFWTKRLMGKLGERAVFIDERGMNFDDTMVSERGFFLPPSLSPSIGRDHLLTSDAAAAAVALLSASLHVWTDIHGHRKGFCTASLSVCGWPKNWLNNIA